VSALAGIALLHTRINAVANATSARHHAVRERGRQCHARRTAKCIEAGGDARAIRRFVQQHDARGKRPEQDDIGIDWRLPDDFVDLRTDRAYDRPAE
jgi:hypothetical protein